MCRVKNEMSSYVEGEGLRHNVKHGFSSPGGAIRSLFCNELS